MRERSEFDPSKINSQQNRLPAPPPASGEDLVIGEPVDTSMLDAALVVYLTFDGYTLRWIGAQAKEWVAFSGVAGENARESEQDIGPTPQGHFTIDPADIQYLVEGPDWGSHRVRLQPVAATVTRMRDCFKLIRTGMYIHGGDVKGTKGCIELNDNAEEKAFFAALAAYGRPIDLEVKYAGTRELAYEAPECPY
ncbi:L,D-transpeptidase [Pseudomonas sp. URMO17WK12:I12]|jgi:hypothetical protein|uniref:L,D-transpeptidase n=1 Tax=Pseudomonas sp. URMO17WK12:I12 TaxID=1259797 RepID=UPI0004872550|nr:L,D-transpeptidase [Pseudomonas sp. URMO17WK12:I12]